MFKNSISYAILTAAIGQCPRFSAGRFSAARFSAARFRAGTVQCPRIHTDLNDNVVNDKIGVHSCKTDATRVEVQRVLNDVKRRAVDTYEAPATIRSASLQNVATPVLASFPSVAATRLIVKRVRRD
uniref:Uncharacterized protein n=1 Tax=Globodera rostochiensis TaxID=31243 RepID=A0A914HKV4_GLORO